MSKTIKPAPPRAAAVLGGCVLLAVTLPACSTPQKDGAPACQGPRRPANPHGSVLAPAIAPTPLAAVAPPHTALCRIGRE